MSVRMRFMCANSAAPAIWNVPFWDGPSGQIPSTLLSEPTFLAEQTLSMMPPLTPPANQLPLSMPSPAPTLLVQSLIAGEPARSLRPPNWSLS
ncbi:hypothetical protein D3C86_1516790 [compost metagenome]